MSPALKAPSFMESIYNLIPKPKEIIVKPKRYASQFSKLIREESKKWKSQHQTMGFAKTPVEQPENYLKKNSRLYNQKSASFLPIGGTVRRPCANSGHRQVVPRHWERPLTAPRSQRNFVLENSLRTTAGKRVSSAGDQKRRVDSSRGHLLALQDAGLFPQYVHKENYGVVPSYLQRYLVEMKRQDKERERQQEEEAELIRISDDERNHILTGLKSQLGELQCQYLSLSVVTDTLAKRQRKLALEAHIDRLQKDINLLERNRTIYVKRI